MKKIIGKKIAAFILTTIGIFSTIVMNAQWQKKASGFPAPRSIVELIAVGDKVAWGVAGEPFKPLWEVPAFNDFTRTTDGGNHWIPGKLTAFPDYILVAIAPLSATVCYGSIANFNTGNTRIVKTTDGGIAWTEQLNFDFGPGFEPFFADIYFFNANDGLIYGDPTNGYFTIFTTQDGGEHWTRVAQANMPAALPDEYSYVFSSEGIGNTFWTVSTSGRVWKTTDKGSHWNAYATEQTSIDFSNLKMRDALHGLLGIRGNLYRTSDGGVTWQKVEYTGNWFTNDLAYVPGTNSTYVSTGSHDMPGYADPGAVNGIGSSYSLDDGNTWITLDTAVEHTCVAMINSYTGFTGGINTTSANGIFKYNGAALGYSCENDLTFICHKGNTICVANASIANHLSHGDVLGDCTSSIVNNNSPALEISEATLRLNAYPNPFTSYATIIYSIPKTGNISLKIYDVMGRQVKTLVNAKVAAGTYNIQWNVNEEKALPAGIYFLRMSTEIFSQTRKLIVVK